MKGLKHGSTDTSKPRSRYNKKCRLEQDGNTCQSCGIGEGLDVHHIDWQGPHLPGPTNNGIDNLITLCHKCHLRLHMSNSERNGDILLLRESGLTYQVIGNMFGLTRQRVQQLIAQYA